MRQTAVEEGGIAAYTAPHYLLFTEANVLGPGDVEDSHVWRFSLERVSDGYAFSASDEEAFCGRERAELLAVVRGLESLEGRSRVTLVTGSRYVSRGLRRGLADWRSNSWRWERFGQLTSVRDADLWRRIDVALQFHQVDCRLWQMSDAKTSATCDRIAPRRRLSPMNGLGSLARGRLWSTSQSVRRVAERRREASLAAG